MKICLIEPASPFLVNQDMMGPLGLWYLGAVLKEAGHEVVYCDLGLGDQIPTADVYGVGGKSPQRDQITVLPKALLSINPKASVIAGGPHFTLHPEEALASGYHAVVQGEGENLLANFLCTPSSFASVRAERIKDLDALSFPDRSQARRYHYTIDGKRATTAITTRGCPYSCAFCCTSVWGRTYVERSAPNVYLELRSLRDQGWDAVMFFDDTLAVNRKRLGEMCSLIAPLGLAWRCLIRADHVRADMAQAMYQAGCVEVGLGVESGSNRILSNIHKGESIGRIEEAIKIARESGIRVKAFFIIGLPGENRESLEETERFIERTRPDDVDFSILSVFDGSPLAAAPDKYDLCILEKGRWYKGQPGKYTSPVATSALSAEDIVAARDYLEARFKDAAKIH